MSSTGIPIGILLAKKRRELGLKAKFVAGASGISPSHLSKIENNRVDPRLSTLLKIAIALETNLILN